MKTTDALFLIGALVIVFFLGYKTGLKRDTTHTVVDTVYKYNAVTFTDTISRWIPKFDTVYIQKDSISYPVSVERLDTTMVKDKDTLSLWITRYPDPSYDVKFKLSKNIETKTVYEKIYLEKPQTWLNKFDVGIGFGYGLFNDGDNIKASPSLNLSVYYKIF